MSKPQQEDPWLVVDEVYRDEGYTNRKSGLQASPRRVNASARPIRLLTTPSSPGSASSPQSFAVVNDLFNVVWQVPSAGGPTLPYAGTVSSTSRAFSLTNTGTAVYCDGKFYQSGGVFEAHPTSTNKPATVKLNDGSRVKLFAEEATEVYFSD